MSGVAFPPGWRLGGLRREHSRKQFHSGQPQVDDWLRTKALQSQQKRLAMTRVLIDDANAIAGYYSLATGQVDFGDLPAELARNLPRRSLPIAVLAWLGVTSHYRGRGLGRSLLAQALRDCHDASQTFPFVAVVLDCVDDAAKSFYQHWDFREMPGHPYRLFLNAGQLEEMMRAD